MAHFTFVPPACAEGIQTIPARSRSAPSVRLIFPPPIIAARRLFQASAASSYRIDSKRTNLLAIRPECKGSSARERVESDDPERGESRTAIPKVSLTTIPKKRLIQYEEERKWSTTERTDRKRASEYSSPGYRLGIRREGKTLVVRGGAISCDGRRGVSCRNGLARFR